MRRLEVAQAVVSTGAMLRAQLCLIPSLDSQILPDPKYEKVAVALVMVL
jgi:hypothetical protein